LVLLKRTALVAGALTAIVLTAGLFPLLSGGEEGIKNREERVESNARHTRQAMGRRGSRKEENFLIAGGFYQEKEYSHLQKEEEEEEEERRRLNNFGGDGSRINTKKVREGGRRPREDAGPSGGGA